VERKPVNKRFLERRKGGKRTNAEIVKQTGTRTDVIEAENK